MDITNGIKVNFIDDDTIIEKNLILQPNVSAEDLQTIEDYVYNEAIKDGAQDLKDYYDPLFEAKSEELDTAISNESTRAQTAEQANATAISNEITRAQTAEQANATAISNEITRAQTAEQANATAISNEITRAQTAEQTIDAKIKKLYRHVIFFSVNSDNLPYYVYSSITAVFYSHKSTQLTVDDIAELLSSNGAQTYCSNTYPASGDIMFNNKYYAVTKIVGHSNPNSLSANYINDNGWLESLPIYILSNSSGNADAITEVSTPL